MKVVRICVICGREREYYRKHQPYIVQVERTVCNDCKNVRIVLNTPKKKAHRLEKIGIYA